MDVKTSGRKRAHDLPKSVAQNRTQNGTGKPLVVAKPFVITEKGGETQFLLQEYAKGAKEVRGAFANPVPCVCSMSRRADSRQHDDTSRPGCDMRQPERIFKAYCRWRNGYRLRKVYATPRAKRRRLWPAEAK
jgi:hypothetical protein